MSVITLNPLKRKIKKHSNKRVSKGALEEFSEVLQAKAEIICEESKKLAEHAGRKTVNKEDIRLGKRKVTKR